MSYDQGWEDAIKAVKERIATRINDLYDSMDDVGYEGYRNEKRERVYALEDLAGDLDSMKARASNF
jgi:hypothetical protein